MRRTYRPWSGRDLVRLAVLVTAGRTRREIAAELGRTVEAVKGAVTSYGLSRRRYDRLRVEAAVRAGRGETDRRVAEKLGVSRAHVTRVRNRLGIPRAGQRKEGDGASD